MGDTQTVDTAPTQSKRRRNSGYVIQNSSNRRLLNLTYRDELWNTGSRSGRPAEPRMDGGAIHPSEVTQVIVGYARVSTDKQDEALQLDALKAAGCEKVFVDKMSGVIADRPQLLAMQAMLRPGDKVVIWKLDRLGRSLVHLVDLVNWFKKQDVDLQVLSGDFPLDTSSAMGEFIFHVFAALAQMERRLIHERTMAGLAAARARGRIGGRPKVLNDKKVARALDLVQHGVSMREAARIVGANRTTMWRYLHEAPAS